VGGKWYALQTTPGNKGDYSKGFVDLDRPLCDGHRRDGVTVLHFGRCDELPARYYRVRLVP